MRPTAKMRASGPMRGRKRQLAHSTVDHFIIRASWSKAKGTQNSSNGEILTHSVFEKSIIVRHDDTVVHRYANVSALWSPTSFVREVADYAMFVSGNERKLAFINIAPQFTPKYSRNWRSISSAIREI
jgi:hypothetical protein